jgi:putative ABC transport system ATP-binding protein
VNSAIEARALAKTYRSGGLDVLALRGIDLTVEPGELVAVIGPSGCGKSTLLHLLAGLARPTAGQILVEGGRIDNRSEAARAALRRQKIGFVFQFFNLLPQLTAAENVELATRLAGYSPNDSRLRRAELFDRLRLSGKEDSAPAHLSGGEQQRVALARAVANRPAVVLADEPTGNLDSESTDDVLDLLRDLRDEGQTMLLVTHEPRVAAIAGRVVTLRDGLVADEARLVGGRGSLALGVMLEAEL